MAIDEQQTDGGDLRGAFFCNLFLRFFISRREASVVRFFVNDAVVKPFFDFFIL